MFLGAREGLEMRVRNGMMMVEVGVGERLDRRWR